MQEEGVGLSQDLAQDLSLDYTYNSFTKTPFHFYAHPSGEPLE